MTPGAGLFLSQGYNLNNLGRGPPDEAKYQISKEWAWFQTRRFLTLLMLNTSCPVLANSADPDPLASEEANRSGSALLVINYSRLSLSRIPRDSLKYFDCSRYPYLNISDEKN